MFNIFNFYKRFKTIDDVKNIKIEINGKIMRLFEFDWDFIPETKFKKIINIFNGNIYNLDTVFDNFIAAHYYEYKNKLKKAEELFIKIYEIDKKDTIYLAKFYRRHNWYELSKKYYLMILDKNNDSTYAYIAEYAKMCMTNCEYNEAEKYLTLCYDYVNKEIAYEKDITLRYQNEDKKIGYEIYILELFVLLYSNVYMNNKAKRKQYMLKLIENGTSAYEKYFTYLYLYHKLGEDYYKNTRDINIFKNKKMKFGKEEECKICTEEALCIPLECTHYLCCDCYTEYYNKKCPFCRISL